MPRKANEENLNELKQLIETAPGKKTGAIARLLSWPREKVTRGLVTLNDEGILLYEDDKGRLFPCRDHSD